MAAEADLWGKSKAPNASGDILRFPGQQYDAESGLHYNYKRYYDPETGRYTTNDPLGLGPSLNPNIYPHNPTMWIDPLGLTSTPSCGGSNANAPITTPQQHAVPQTQPTTPSSAPYNIPVDQNGIPVGGHTSGTSRPPTMGATPNSVYTRTGSNGVPVQNTIYNGDGNAVGHFDFKTHPGTSGPHGHVFTTPGTIEGHGAGAAHIPASNLPPGWDIH
ncbi:RHS repeat-associated core domain-containing protein [Nocardia sp. AG03]|uniref:RHS repeat-associated core domain-containing protein n=1 Tax=Nocardia sp. AG03 TaxID=3025312 RepID=UPI00325B83AC